MIKKAVLGVMTVGLLSLAPVAQSQASTQSADSVSAPQSKQRLAYVTGFVLNQLGDPQDDVNVEVFRAGELDTPVASQLTYASVWDDAEPADHGFYNIELRFDPTLGNEFVVRFSSLPDAETQFRPYTYPKTFVAKGDYPYFDLPDVRMKLAKKVATATRAGVHKAKKGKPTGDALEEIPADTSAVVAVQVNVAKGQPDILKTLGAVTLSVTHGSGKKEKVVKKLKQDLKPTKRTGASEAVMVLPELAGSTAYVVEVCEGKGKKKKCKDVKKYTSSETYTLHVSYGGSDEAKASDTTFELKVLAPKRARTIADQRPNAWL